MLVIFITCFLLNFRSRSTPSKYFVVKSTELIFSLTFLQLKYYAVDILSIFNETLLFGRSFSSELFISSWDGVPMATITINDTGKLSIATWTPRGNIVYATQPSEKVVTISAYGKVITSNKIAQPLALSVSKDNFTYLVTLQKGIYQSADDGLSWSFLFKLNEKWLCIQFIKVINKYTDDFWMLETRENNKFKLNHFSVYSVIKKYSVSFKQCRNININTTLGRHANFIQSRLSIDSNNNIFISDYSNNTVHLLSIGIQCRSQLLSSLSINGRPLSLAVDSTHNRLYVGKNGGLVDVFDLSYGDKNA